MSATSSTVQRTTEISTNDGIENRFVIARCNRNTSKPGQLRIDDQETGEEPDHEERLLTVCCRAGRLGAAAYTVGTGELQILEEIVDRPPDHQIFLSLFHQLDPAQLILDGKSQGTFVSVVKRLVFSDANEAKCRLIFVSNKEYNFEACKRRIYSLSLPHEPSNCSDEERTLFIRTVIDFSQTQTVHALGTMLRYLDLNWSHLCMSLHGRPDFLTLKRISLHDIVSIDEDTYKGLQIFSSLGHPSGFKRGAQGSNKEGLSLFQMFSKCASKVGHRRMRAFLRHPTTHVPTLQRRQAAVAYLMRPQSDSVVRDLCSSLRFVKNVNGILAKIKALSAKPYQWKSLYNTLYHVVLICEMCENTGNEYLEQIASLDTNKLYEMALYMNRIIDFELSKSEGKFTVKTGVDPDLDRKKQTMASLHGLMSETAKVELERLPTFIEECTMLYMPHLGYLLGVKAWDRDPGAERKELPHMKFMVTVKSLQQSNSLTVHYRHIFNERGDQFQNNDYIHYKSRGCEELDVMIGDTYPELAAHETRIMMRLTAVILDHLQPLAALVDRCAELDCLITISKVCKEYNFVQPTITTDQLIDVKRGRHPLLLTTCGGVVPNDVTCSQRAGFIKILTGPNASGKSVYMKQTGLIVYLAHIGSFVPAEAATVGVVSHIFSRIQSAESVAAHMSAFLIDLRQMSRALRCSGRRSLVLVEEPGAGSSGGAPLAAAVVAALARAPRAATALITTHHRHLATYVADDSVRFLSMEYMLHEGSPVFLYRAVEAASEGRASPGGEGLALRVAAANGLQPCVMDRAGVVMEALAKNSLPPPNKKIMTKLKTITAIIKNDLLTEDI